MLERLKVALVESYVGAIALGWIFSQGILYFAFIFVAPLAAWAQRREYSGLNSGTTSPMGFTLQVALPYLYRCVGLLVVGYLLLRWLYFKTPERAQVTETGSE
jgi:hypothetical protein